MRTGRRLVLPRRRFFRSSSQVRLPKMPAAWTKTALCCTHLVRDECSWRAAPRTRDVYPRRQLGEPRHRMDLKQTLRGHQRRVTRVVVFPRSLKPNRSLTLSLLLGTAATPAFESSIDSSMAIAPVRLDAKAVLSVRRVGRADRLRGLVGDRARRFLIRCPIYFFIHVCVLQPIRSPFSRRGSPRPRSMSKVRELLGAGCSEVHIYIVLPSSGVGPAASTGGLPICPILHIAPCRSAVDSPDAHFT